MSRIITGFLLVAVCLGPGCARRADSRHWIQQAREANLVADQALRHNDRRTAVASLRKIVEADAPGNIAESDARAVRQDACFRLASIELDSNRPQEALGWSNRGIGLGGGSDVFTANLLVARGRALQQQGKELQAVKDYHRALIINESLLDKALGPAQERSQP